MGSQLVAPVRVPESPTWRIQNLACGYQVKRLVHEAIVDLVIQRNMSIRRSRMTGTCGLPERRRSCRLAS